MGLLFLFTPSSYPQPAITCPIISIITPIFILIIPLLPNLAFYFLISGCGWGQWGGKGGVGRGQQMADLLLGKRQGQIFVNQAYLHLDSFIKKGWDQFEEP